MKRIWDFFRSDENHPVLRLPTALVLFGAFFLLTRLAVIFNPEDSGWNVMVDELPTGNVALDLENHLVMPLPLYQTKPFAAGTIWEGMLSYPLRRVFGPTLFSLKSAAVLWNLAAMLLWVTLAWKWAGRGAALVAGALFCASPPFFALMTVTAWGNHCESSLPAALSLIFLFPALTRRRESPAIGYAFLAGLFAGLGVYLTFTGLPAFVLGVVIILLIGAAVGRTRVIPAYLAGAFAGVSPLAWSVRYFGLEGMSRIDTYTGYASGVMVSASDFFMESSLAQSFLKFVDFWTDDLWRSALYPEGFDNRVPRFLIAAIVVVAAFAIGLWIRRAPIMQSLRHPLRKKDREDILPLLPLTFPLFVVFFSVAYALSGFRVLPVRDADPSNYANYRYLVPVYPFLFLLVGCGAQDLWNALSGRKAIILRAALLACLSFFMAVSMDFYFRLGRTDPPDFRAFLYRGDDALHLMDRMAAEETKLHDSFSVKIDKIEQLRPVDRAFLFERMSRVSDEGFHKGILLSQNLGRDYRPVLYRGLGWGLAERAYSEGSEKRIAEYIGDLLRRAQPLSDAAVLPFLEGVGHGMSFASRERVARLVDAASAWDGVPETWRDAVKIGIGRKIGAMTHIDDTLGEPKDGAYYIGLGAQLRRNAELQCVRFDKAAEAILEQKGARRAGLLKGFAREGREFFDEGP